MISNVIEIITEIYYNGKKELKRYKYYKGLSFIVFISTLTFFSNYWKVDLKNSILIGLSFLGLRIISVYLILKIIKIVYYDSVL